MRATSTEGVAPWAVALEAPVPVWVEPLPLTQLEPDLWYLGWRCARCGWISAIEPDPTCGALLLRLKGRGVACFKCISCSSFEVQTPGQCGQYLRSFGNSYWRREVPLEKDQAAKRAADFLTRPWSVENQEPTSAATGE